MSPLQLLERPWCLCFLYSERSHQRYLGCSSLVDLCHR